MSDIHIISPNNKEQLWQYMQYALKEIAPLHLPLKTQQMIVKSRKNTLELILPMKSFQSCTLNMENSVNTAVPNWCLYVPTAKDNSLPAQKQPIAATVASKQKNQPSRLAI